MKQTNNAIKFLLAQYRAIFKSAYIKGLASAVVLTSTLAAGSAQAALNTVKDVNDLSGSSVTVTTDSPLAISGAGTGFGAGTKADPAKFNKDIVINAGEEHKIAAANGAELYVYSSTNMTVNSGTALAIGDSSQTNATDIRFGKQTVAQGATLNVQAGSNFTRTDAKQFDIKGIVNVYNTANADAFLTGDKIDISGKDAVVNLGKSDVDADTTKVRSVLGWRAEQNAQGTVLNNGSDITLTQGATLNLNAKSDPSKINTPAYPLYGSLVWGNSFTANNGFIKVGEGAFAGLATKTSTITNSVVTVGNGSTLAVLPLAYAQMNQTGYPKENAYLNVNGTSTVNGGTFIIEGTTLLGRGGTLEISDQTVLTAGSASAGYAGSAVSSNGVLAVGFNSTDISDITSQNRVLDGTTNPTLKLSSKQLKSFLTSGDATVSYTDKTGQTVTSTDNAGRLDLTDGARLQFTDTDTVEISNFKFSSTTDDVKAGEIRINFNGADIDNGVIGTDDDGHTPLKGDIRIMADKMSISKSLLSSAADTTTSSLDGKFVANVMTLGSSSFDSDAIALGVHDAVAFDEIHFADKSGTFHVKDSITLTRDFYTKDANGDYTTTETMGGTINGADLSIENGKAIQILGGAWENTGNQSLTITEGATDSEGALYITAQASPTTSPDKKQDEFGNSWDYYKSGNPGTLTWHGDFILDGKGGNAQKAQVVIRGKTGANATLDLRDADITWGAGQIIVESTNQADGSAGDSGEVVISPTDPEIMAGNGILMLTGDQLTEFAHGKDVKTAIKVGNTSGIMLTGTTIDPINFSTLVNSKDQDGSGPTFTAGTITFTGKDGALVSDSVISLVTGVDLDGDNQVDGADKDLRIGDNNIIAPDIIINNKAKKGSTTDDSVTVSGKTMLSVSRSLSSENATIEFNEGAELFLDSDLATDQGYVNTSLAFGSSHQDGTTTKLRAENGNWTVNGNIDLAAGAVLNVGAKADPDKAEAYFERYGTAASLTANNLAVQRPDSGNAVEINYGSAATFNTMQAQNAGILIIGGTLSVVGRNNISDAADSKDHKLAQAAKDTAGIDLTGAKINISSGKMVLGDIAASTLFKFDNNTVTVNDVLSKANIALDGNSEFKLDFSKESADKITTTGLTVEQAQALKENLIASMNGSSFINVGQLKLDIKYNSDNMTGSWDDVGHFASVISEVTNDDLKQLLITGITSSDKVTGHFGAMQTDSTGKLTVDGNLGLHNARNGYFAFSGTDGAQKAAAISLSTKYSSVQLDGAGKVGAITGSGVNDKNAVIFDTSDSTINKGTTEVLGDIKKVGSVVVNNDVTVSGTVEAGKAELARNLEVAGDTTFTTMRSLQGSALKTKNLTVTEEGLIAGNTTIAGKLALGKSNKAAVMRVAGGNITASEFEMAKGSTVYIGQEAKSADDSAEAVPASSGRLEIQTAAFNDGALISALDTSSTAAVTSIAQFKGGDLKSKNAGTVDGSIFAGQNAVVGIGTTSVSQLEEAVAKYQNNGTMKDYGAILALDGRITLTAGHGLVMTATSIKDFKEHTTPKSRAASTLNQHNTFTNSAYFGQDTALLVSADSLNAAHDAGAALVTFSDDNAQLVADGGEILVSGNLRANQDYTLFADTSKDDGGKVNVVDVNGNSKDVAIEVKTENGFLSGTITDETGGKVKLGLSQDSRSVMSDASEPVYQTLVAYINGYNGKAAEDGSVKEEQKLYYGYTKDGEGNKIKNYTYSNYFLKEVTGGNGTGKDAETVARLGVFGGSVQAALAAGNTTSEAIAGRFGMGAQNSAMSFADNGQGAGLWVTPVYRSADSDSFDADGLDYGVDLNLYGVALGGDYTLSNGLRVGAMFNVGSGDADGQGAGSLATNDFDYYGFAAFAGYTMDKFSIVGDISYTVVDNEVTANTSVDKIGAKFDSTNLSLGVTAQYALSFNGMEVTPHAGLRLSRIDLDDYLIDGEDEVADYNADSLNVFSLPVGVTIAKEFTGETWKVKPSFDLTLTGNFGDDKAEGTVDWSHVDNLTTSVSSEVFDNFTYGATVGVAAQTGNFSLGFGLNYTGSSNVNEFGVNANARYTF